MVRGGHGALTLSVKCGSCFLAVTLNKLFNLTNPKFPPQRFRNIQSSAYCLPFTKAYLNLALTIIKCFT